MSITRRESRDSVQKCRFMKKERQQWRQRQGPEREQVNIISIFTLLKSKHGKDLTADVCQFRPSIQLQSHSEQTNNRLNKQTRNYAKCISMLLCLTQDRIQIKIALTLQESMEQDKAGPLEY